MLDFVFGLQIVLAYVWIALKYNICRTGSTSREEAGFESCVLLVFEELG
jgi:hypothetical protein